MSEIVERVAAAIKAKLFEAAKRDDEVTHEEIARVAIEAMREPTEDMQDEACVAESNSAPSYRTIWQAMIDEALK